MTVSAIAGRQLPILALIVPLWVCVTMCGFKRSLEVLPAIIVGGVCFAGAQFLLANYHGPTLPDIGSAIRHHCGPCAAAQGLEAFAHVPVRG